MCKHAVVWDGRKCDSPSEPRVQNWSDEMEEKGLDVGEQEQVWQKFLDVLFCFFPPTVATWSTIEDTWI